MKNKEDIQPVIDNLRDKFFKECVDRLLVWPRQFDASKEDNATIIFEWFVPYLKSNSEPVIDSEGQSGIRNGETPIGTKRHKSKTT